MSENYADRIKLAAEHKHGDEARRWLNRYHRRSHAVKFTDSTGTPTAVEVEWGLSFIFGQAPYFTVTSAEYQQTGERSALVDKWASDERYVLVSCGTVGESTLKHAAHLKGHTQWHLVSLTDGPMHYYANSTYWWWQRHVEHFKSCSLWGALPDDEIEYDVTKSDIFTAVEPTPFLQRRFGRLMESFYTFLLKEACTKEELDTILAATWVHPVKKGG